MRKLFIQVASWLTLKILALRYKIEVKGLDQLKLKKGGALFLPNHPAEIDPIIINNLLLPKFNPRSLVIEHFYYLKGVRFFMNIVRALPIPNFELSSNSWKMGQIEKSLNQVKEGIQKGENFLIYPSGHLKSEGHEIIGGNSFIHSILQTCTGVQVVLIRISGLWGSSFSRALTGRSPDFWKMFSQGIKTAIKNGIFFIPRRSVTIEVELADENFPYHGSRLELNQYLEGWYNQYLDPQGRRVVSEPLRRISFSIFSDDLPSITKQERKQKEKKDLNVPNHIREALYKELKKISGMNEIREEMELSRDLGLDSLDIASIHVFLDHHFDVESSTSWQLRTVYDLLEVIVEESLEHSKLDREEQHHHEWPEENGRPPLTIPDGKSIQECFLKVCDRMGKKVACGDDLAKVMTYQDLKVKVMVLAQKFKQLPEKHVAVLLPSSVACYVIILSLLFAGKVPVMLNWTAGLRNLRFARDLLGLKTILTSRRFLERVESLDLGELEELLVLMEEYRHTLTFRDKMKGFLLSRKSGKKLYDHFELEKVKEGDPAVVLFTSGTESYPKAVPLSHRNILSNQRAAVSSGVVKETDILYGVLPPFHSFGFSVTGLFPLLAGLRVFYSPDPTDSHRMARDCFLRNITVLCSAPSFYRNLFRIATQRELKSVRLIVSGAEKAPAELFEHAKRFGKEMVEGYGITECSPIVTINRVGFESHGVGQTLSGVELCTIHPETHEKLSQGSSGEICIHGSNVFSGYLGDNPPNPFIEIEGKQWYRSGDLGHVSPDGALILGGRLKRFVKIGGEMVSLIALEEELIHFCAENNFSQKDEDGPQLTIGVKEDVKPKLILFTTFAIDKQQANEALIEAGFARIVKIAEVKQIPEIPMTGTGKVQLRTLNEMIYAKNI